ncbi:P-loop containing nucleoside triphosphate hydrolase protein [Parathielavia hyrcaniae]|uniref:P-loop containing nucleoside triphosphate hydrolase protein n=1 Tax=Parathielavia hyrcaniae TaxID=113614 RepID=A0AAN6T2E9_9PEZI|nr:P-loop containing nucleoside triphosphate hydrolase protein [Parathielavia hyrcaniae]
MVTPKRILPSTISSLLTRCPPCRHLSTTAAELARQHASTKTTSRSASSRITSKKSTSTKITPKTASYNSNITPKTASSNSKTTTKPKPGPDQPPPPALSYLPPPSNDPHQRALPAPRPLDDTLSRATAIFTAKPAAFLYCSSRFLEIPPNTHTPEVCLLGRSNTGKSTLINALAGAASHRAGHLHPRQARALGLAITSRIAGSTRSLNAYGFGVPGREQRLAALQRAKEVKDGLERELGGIGTRSKRRALSGRKEAPPMHRLIMVDMPGYGLGSEADWGKEIKKYLGRREMLRGAVVLVDAVAGVKDADRMVLEILRDAEVKTAVVLTKVDKLARDAQAGKAQSRVDEVCLSVWEELRRIERGSLTWLEESEKGWQHEIWATSAGDPDAYGEGVGVVGARWAICRMAGLVEDSRVLKPSQPAQPIQKIVSFDDIQRMVASAERKAKKSPGKVFF